MFIFCLFMLFVFFFKQKTAYEMRISDWSSDVCSSDLCSGNLAQRSEVMERMDRTEAGLFALFLVGLAGAAIVASAGLTEFSAAGRYALLFAQIGRASCRERVCQYV